MTPDRPAIDSRLARRLVDSQFPQWRDQPLRRLRPAGSDHVIYRLGDELSVRIPRHSGAIGQAAKEAQWLPRLAPHLPLPVPTPVAVGRPDFGYPWPWAVSQWLPGTVATVGELGASVPAALELAGFLSALQQLEVPPGLPPGRLLSDRDHATRTAIAELADVFDAAALTRVWEQALTAPAWDRPPVWFHGDFHTGNLLTTGGRLPHRGRPRRRRLGPGPRLDLDRRSDRLPRLRRHRRPGGRPDHPPDHRRPGRRRSP